MYTYDDFVFIKNNKGYYMYIDCTQKPHPTWKNTATWTAGNKNEEIVVFVYQAKIMMDTGYFALAFTTKQNFENRENSLFDFDNICKLDIPIRTFFGAQKYIAETFGYKKENISDETGNPYRYYSLGVIQI